MRRQGHRAVTDLEAKKTDLTCERIARIKALHRVFIDVDPDPLDKCVNIFRCEIPVQAEAPPPVQARHLAAFPLASPSARRPNVATKSVPLRASPAPARKTPTWFVRPFGGVPFTVSWNTE